MTISLFSIFHKVFVADKKSTMVECTGPKRDLIISVHDEVECEGGAGSAESSNICDK